MAGKKSSMTPEAAAAAIAEVGEYRQGLTARAAGIIWMIWGFFLAALAIADLASWSDGNGAGFDLTDTMEIVFILVLFAAAFATTWAVWHSQALVTGHGVRMWATTGMVLLILVVTIGVAQLGFYAFLETVLPGPDPHYRTAQGFVMASVAAAIMVLQRRRVAWWPGMIAVVAGVALQVTYPYLIGSGDAIAAFVRLSFLEGAVAVAAFVTVGLTHFLRG